jgi:hypothetical protein
MFAFKPPAIAARATPMSPGTYIRLRRESAGLDLNQVGAALGRTPAARADVRRDVFLLEEDRPPASPQRDHLHTIARLRGLFPFDTDIALVLIGFAADPASDLPSPRICTGCGCTWNDGCGKREGVRFCCWRDDDTDRCTACPPALDLAPVTRPANRLDRAALVLCLTAAALAFAAVPGRALAHLIGI